MLDSMASVEKRPYIFRGFSGIFGVQRDFVMILDKWFIVMLCHDGDDLYIVGERKVKRIRFCKFFNRSGRYRGIT